MNYDRRQGAGFVIEEIRIKGADREKSSSCFKSIALSGSEGPTNNG